MKIELLEIAGFAAAIRSMRLPMRSGERSDSKWVDGKFVVGPKDLALSAHLQSKGPEHGKHLRGIIAWLEITAPLYWWTEAVTYEVGVVKLSSTSSMHTECKRMNGEELQRAKGAIRGDYEYTRIWAISYETLSRMYHQRDGHRLPEWEEFQRFVWSLPLVQEMIIDHAPCVRARQDAAIIEQAEREEGFHGQ